MYSILHFFFKRQSKIIIEIGMHIESNKVKSITNPQNISRQFNNMVQLSRLPSPELSGVKSKPVIRNHTSTRT